MLDDTVDWLDVNQCVKINHVLLTLLYSELTYLITLYNR